MSSPGEEKKSPNSDKSHDEDTIPLKDAEKSHDNSSKNSLSKDQSSSATIDINDTTAKERKRNRFRGSYENTLSKLELTEKSRSTFFALLVVILLLLLVIIILSILWPSIPSYLKYPVCNSKTCLETSLQILSWSDQNEGDTCGAPYALTCGRFHDEFQDHELFNRFRGEWNQRNIYKYREMVEINNFITKQLNSTGSSVFIKELYNSCMKLDKTDKDSSLKFLKKVFRTLGGWHIIDDPLSKWNLKQWDIKEILPILHSNFGISLFFKISLRDRDTAPYGKIIAISEGDFGLPHKDLYMIEAEGSEIVQSYLEFLTNVFKLFDRTTEEAKILARNVYGYERRIVKDAYYLNKEVPSTGEIIQLDRFIQEASSLAIYNTVQRVFSKTKLPGLEIWVEDLEKLKEVSRIISTQDVSVVNDIVAWSVIKKLLPYLSKEFQKTYAQFDYQTYGIESLEPSWYQCTDIVNRFVPVGLEVLRLQNQPRLRTLDESKEYIQTIFDQLKEVVSEEINDVLWISESLSKYLIDNLSKMTLQIGVPQEILSEEGFVAKYYSDFLPQTIFFVDNVEELWTFEKTILEKQLGELPHRDELMYEMFPVSGKKHTAVRYSSNLNTLIIQDSLLRHNYFNKDIPISINFARVGTDIAEALIDAIQTLSYRYSNDVTSSKPLPYGTVIEDGTTTCLNLPSPFDRLPVDATRHQLVSLSATRLTKTAITEVLHKLKTKDGHIMSQFGHHMTNGDFQRLPSLQQFTAHQLFNVALMQRHCSSSSEKYQQLKPFVEQELSKRDTYENLWTNIRAIRKNFGCPIGKTEKCENLL